MRSITILIGILLVVGCDSKKMSYGDLGRTDQLEDPGFHSKEKESFNSSLTSVAEDITMPEPAEPSKPVESSDGIANAVQRSSQKIIRTAHVNLQVDKLDSISQVIENHLENYQAYISQSSQSNQIDGGALNMTIRVPPTKMDKLLDFVEAQAVHINSKEITSRDIGEEYVDTQTRIENKKRAEARFRDILKDAKNVKEILTVENQLRKVREEIESAEGRLRYLGQQSALSTVHLVLNEPIYNVAEAPGPSYLSQIGTAFTRGWTFMKSLTIAIIYVWPAWIVLIAVFLLVRRRKFQLRQKAM